MQNFFAPFPFLRYCGAYIIGILLYLNFEFPIKHLSYQILIICFIYSFIYFKFGNWSRAILGYLGILILIALGYNNSFNAFKYNSLGHISTKNTFQFYTAKIVSIVEEKPNSWKAFADVESVIDNRNNIESTGKVLLYFDKDKVAKPTYGDILLIKNKPAQIEAPKNPNQFDYKRYMAYQGIYHQQYLTDTSFTSIGTDKALNFKNIAIRINNYSDSLFTQYFKSKTELAVTNAMVLGLRDDIDNDLISAYSAAGAIHVLSVSGLHVGVIYIILVWLFGCLKRNKPIGIWLFLTLILFTLWLYAAVTGFSAPVMRSTFMFSIILLAETLKKQNNSYNTLAISAFCILLFDPLAVTNVGFMLSYLAVFGMILIQPMLNPLVVINKKTSKIHWLADRLWKVTTVAVAAQIATLPITIYYFHQFPNYFLLVNPIVILLSSVVLIGGLAFLFLGFVLSFFHLYILINWIAVALEFFVKCLNKTVLFTENIPGSVAKYLNFGLLEVLILYLLIISIVANFKYKKFGWVKVASFSTLLLIGLSIKKYTESKNQSLVCIHAIPKATAISLIEGTNTIFFVDSAMLTDRKLQSYYLNNFWAEKGTVNFQKKAIESNSVIKIWKNKKFLFLNNKINNLLIVYKFFY